ncbi:cytochrome c oxidase assembly protein [Marininema halotolerans]|uniref:Putative membrane protein n=1 Tax=Marininema halotolerans TaxID=1155944 RepID=A0A1I6NQ82_9BACL|nr:cytochrome c oxidase assembly protein [Marininema halotolerans]SFS30030.1 putative membrane protein [Marininema halotolerans]
MEALIRQFLILDMWNLGLNFAVIFLGMVYLVLTSEWGIERFAGEVVSPSQKMLFLLGLFILYGCLGSPMVIIGHELFSIHMLQQSLLYLVMPPLLIRGIPIWMWRRAFSEPWLKTIFRPAKRPLITLFFFNGLFSLYHVPLLFDQLMSSEFLHLLSHFVLILSATLMWWPVMNPLQEEGTLTPIGKLAYIAGAGVLLTPACALIIFADHLLFASYSESGRMFPILSPLDDQQLGGVIMKVIQEIVYGVMLGVVFFQWVREERAKDESEAVVAAIGRPVPTWHIRVLEGGKDRKNKENT